jgi:hypothetical protein
MSNPIPYWKHGFAGVPWVPGFARQFAEIGRERSVSRM